MGKNLGSIRVRGSRRAVPGRPSSVPGKPPRVPGNPTKGAPGQGALRDYRGRYVKGGSGISWYGLETIHDNMEDVAASVHKLREGVAERLKDKMLTYAIINAPWTDDTYMARASLKAAVFHDDQARRSTIALAHGVDYGIYLETMSGGAYAIILPTILHFAERVGGEVREGL